MLLSQDIVCRLQVNWFLIISLNVRTGSLFTGYVWRFSPNTLGLLGKAQGSMHWRPSAITKAQLEEPPRYSTTLPCPRQSCSRVALSPGPRSGASLPGCPTGPLTLACLYLAQCLLSTTFSFFLMSHLSRYPSCLNHPDSSPCVPNSQVQPILLPENILNPPFPHWPYHHSDILSRFLPPCLCSCYFHALAMV